MNKINCRNCAYYYITWDAGKPNGCRYFGFKSQPMPSVSVFRSSGEPCKAYTLKNKVTCDSIHQD